MKNNVLFSEECFEIQGVIFDLFKEIGPGFAEPIYQECLEIEFLLKNIPFDSQVELRMLYKGKPLKQYFKVDFVCYDKIIIEIKAVSELTDIHRSQLINYLKISKLKLGLLVNFCSYPKVTIERFLN